MTNNGPDSASNVVVTDAVPAALSVDAVHDGGGDCSASAGSTVSCTRGSLANGATWTVTVDVTVDPAHLGGTISNRRVFTARADAVAWLRQHRRGAGSAA